MSQSNRAHRLSQKAFSVGGQDMQISFLLAVFKAYLQEAKDIGDIDILADLSEQLKVMPKDEVRRILPLNCNPPC